METTQENVHFPNTGNGVDDGDVRTISEREFSKLVGISVSMACKLRRAGKLAHCREGKRVIYIFPRHVQEYLASIERRPLEPRAVVRRLTSIR